MRFLQVFSLSVALLSSFSFAQEKVKIEGTKEEQLKVIDPLSVYSLSATDRSLLMTALAKSGANRGELLKAIENAPSADQREGIVFLISYMPERDLRDLSAKFLLENVKWAYKARAEFPWTKDVPKEIFLNDVLPYANLNERRDNWRADFYKRFKNKVKGAKTLKEAIYLVNKDIEKEVKVKYSTKRKKPDQSPYESMDLGLASCSGLSIILSDAFRSVGIPARVAGTPSWTTVRGNHNWVEVYVDKQWKFTEFYPDKELNRSWFLERAAKADEQDWQKKIYAASFTPTEYWFPMVWDYNIRYIHGVDVTKKYHQIYRDQNKKVTMDKMTQAERAVLVYANGKKVAVAFTVKDKEGKKVASGKTKDALADLNNMLIFKLQKNSSYILEYKNLTGKRQSLGVQTTDGKELQKLEIRL